MAGSADAARSTDLLDRLVMRLRTSGAIARPELQRMIGTRLRIASKTRSYGIYEADVAATGGAGMHVELREPLPGGGATAGSLLIVRVPGCRGRRDVIARYGPLAITEAPHGHSLDEETYWTYQARNGQLSFGFAERAPDCLSSVVFDAIPDRAAR